MNVDTPLLVASLGTIAVASGASAFLVLGKQRKRRAYRRAATWALCGAAIVALAAWFNFGRFHNLYVDVPGANAASPARQKTERHLPLHFHEVFHYYLGSKYFRELGYEGLYDCTTLADQELARQDGVEPRIHGWVRDLDDVLLDKPLAEATAHCAKDFRPRFSDARWAAFEQDIRELRRLVPDAWWQSAVFDAGFNPPPSWVLLGSTVANALPLRAGETPTVLLATSIDVVLLVVCFVALRRSFGLPVAAMAVVFFGASYIASYGWNGGAFLRFTWLTTLVLALWAMRRGRWALAGALFAASACDRVFPVAFAVGAALPLAWRAYRSRSIEDRRRLMHFGAGFAGTAVALVLVSLAVFGADAWRVFVMRIVRHGDVYYGMHIGLKKVLTWRAWTLKQDFHGHEGLARFHDWNVRLRETWASMRPIAIPVQLAAAGGAAYAGIRRKPYESALLFGLVGMFFFNLPANYYYVVLCLVPALLLRSAATAVVPERRQSDLTVLGVYIVFWVTTLLAPFNAYNDLAYNHTVSLTLGVVIALWIVAWCERKKKPGRPREADPGHGRSPHAVRQDDDAEATGKG
jgi:hypothetical protein